MGIAAVARVAGHGLGAFRIDSGAGEIRVDAPQQLNHPARGVLSRIRVAGKSSGASVAISAIHVKSVAEFFHDRSRAMDPRPGRQYSEVGPRIRRGDRTRGITPVQEVNG